MNPVDLPDRGRLIAALQRHAPAAARTEPRLAAALEQVTTNPGKLLRAALAVAAAERNGMKPAAAEQLACALEFFHAASLLLDDLPCMDDAATRRGLACVHRRYGEATAILAALALINRAYALVAEAFLPAAVSVRREAMRLLDRHLGLAGLVGGQAWDLAFVGTDRSAATVSRIAAGKTGALFALTVLLPALPARPAAATRRRLRALAVYWAQLFQALDDVRDLLGSSLETGKTTGRDRALGRPNLAVALGLPATRARLARLERQIGRTLDQLEAGDARWEYLRRFHAAIGATFPAVRAPQTVAA